MSDKTNLYSERANIVAALLQAYAMLDIKIGFYIDPEAGKEWPVVFAELPEGQVTWHFSRKDFDRLGLGKLLKKFSHNYDGHSTEEKYRRLAAFNVESKNASRKESKLEIDARYVSTFLFNVEKSWTFYLKSFFGFRRVVIEGGFLRTARHERRLLLRKIQEDRFADNWSLGLNDYGEIVAEYMP